MKTKFLTLLAGAALVALPVSLWLFSPQIRGVMNQKHYEVQKVNERTSYKVRKEVEDTARSMVETYKESRLAYEKLKDSDNPEHQSWALSYWQRANDTAISFNEYILKNSYVWEGNVPADIAVELEVVE